MVTRVRDFLIAGLLLLLASGHASTQGQTASRITAPEQALGARIGDDYFLATFPQFETYWKRLDQESDRMELVDSQDRFYAV